MTTKRRAAGSPLPQNLDDEGEGPRNLDDEVERVNPDGN